MVRQAGVWTESQQVKPEAPGAQCTATVTGLAAGNEYGFKVR